MNIKYIIAAGLLAFTVTTRAQNKQENMKFQEETLHLTTEWDKVFPQSDKVNHSKVTFHNRYGVTLAADLYMPKDKTGKLPAIAVCGPFGAVKEQASGLYAQELAKRGFLAIAFDPFLPFSSEKLRKMLNMDTFEWSELGRDNLLPVGHQLNKPELLFEKIEDATIEAQVQKLLDTKKANEEANYKANPIRPNIEFDDFTKLDIRVGTILECQKVPKADKLLQFKIDDGLETRTIVSGIAKHYQPEELVGKQVCFIANLAPRKLKGIISEGMILSAENNDGSLAVIMPGREVKPGSEVK